MRAYLTPFGIVYSDQDPTAMHLRNVGGIEIHRPRIEAELRIRQEAEQKLRDSFNSGVYADSTEINTIIQSHFSHFDRRLQEIIPRIGSRHFMEFVLFQYDQSCKIDALDKRGSLSSEDSSFWIEIGPKWRRAIKHLAECTCLLAPGEAPDVDNDALLDLTDEAIICAEQLVWLATMSDQTFMLFPDNTELEIYKPGSVEYFDLKLTVDSGKEFQSRVREDVLSRSQYVGRADYPIFDKDIRREELNHRFHSAFGLTYEEAFHALAKLIHGANPAAGDFSVPFVHRGQICDRMSEIVGVGRDSIEKLIDGFTVKRGNMVREGRKLWKPKQEHRAYRRGIFDFPHETGEHLTWSQGMAKESLILLLRDLAFQHAPPEWEAMEIRAGLNSLSNRCGSEFETCCNRQWKDRGFFAPTNYKNGIGVGESRIAIPDEVGELDCLSYSPESRMLILLEYKLVQSGTEAARFRDDISKFTSDNDGYFVKYSRKYEWLLANLEGVCRAIESIPGAPERVNPSRIAGAIVTFFPSFSSYRNPPVPCVSLSEILSSWDKKRDWPFSDGVIVVPTET